MKKELNLDFRDKGSSVRNITLMDKLRVFWFSKIYKMKFGKNCAVKKE